MFGKLTKIKTCRKLHKTKMQILIQLIVVLLLILVVYQDYKFRAVSWIIFPLLLVTFFCFNILTISFWEVLDNSKVNFLFIVFLFGMITLYFSIKHNRLINISNGFIGWGDILFIFCLGILFSPLNFMMFYLFSITLIIIGVLFSRLIFKSNSDKIPLAGLQSMILLLIWVVNLVFPFGKFCADDWILNVLL